MVTGKRVLTTTTTKIFSPTGEESPATIVSRFPEEIVEGAELLLEKYSHLTMASEYLQGYHKLKGLESSAIQYISQSNLFDFIVIEANVIVNSEYGTGQSSSLQAGLGTLPVDTDGLMFLLGDQPFIDHKIIDNLICTFQKRQSSLIIPTYQEKRGNPVLIHSSIFDMMKKITGDVGARVLFGNLSSQIQEVEVSDPGILVDMGYD